MDSNAIYVYTHKFLINFLLDLPNSNTETYRKYLQSIYQVIKEVNERVLIVKHKSEKEEEVIEDNAGSVIMMAKNKLLNHTEAILKFL